MAEKSKSDRIAKMIDSVTKAAAGDYSHRIDPSDKKDALDSLACAIDTLRNNVAEQINECKQIWDTLKESTEKYRRLKANIPGMVYMFALHSDGSYSFPYVSTASRELFDLEPQDIMRDRTLLVGLRHPDDTEKMDEAIRRSAATLEPFRYEVRHIVNGKVRWYDCISRPELQPNGNVIWDGIMLEITDRKRAEEALRESNERFRVLFENAPDPFFIYKMDGTLLDGNKAAEKLLGYKKEELVGRNFLEMGILSDQDLPEVRNLQEQTQKGNPTGPDDFTLYKKDGASIWAEISTIPVEIRDEKLVLGIARDVTDSKQAAEALRLSEEKFSKAFQSSPVWVSITTVGEGRFLEVNDTFTKISGFTREEAIGSTSFSLGFWLDPERDREQALQIFRRQGYFRNLEIKMRFKDGKDHTMLWSGDPIDFEEQKCLISVLTDITEHKIMQEEKAALESRLQQAQKMEAIGTLAGGIAHDFNNILAAVIGYTELALSDAEKETTLYQNLQEVFQASNRAKNLIKQILAFSRQNEQERKAVQVKLICTESIKFLRASLPTSLKIRQKIESDSLVMADPTQIHQVLMNLCTNAGHAMGDKDGVLEVKLKDVKLEADITAKHPELKPGPYLELTVSDTGHGIPAHIIERIFDPFFTTKGKAEGTGMGLSVVHGIVGSYGGTITVASEPGKGATFKIYLPAVERDKASVSKTAEPIATGTERILFVDDETALVNIGKQMLESLGYKITTRTSSIEALELFKARADSFDLVITDMTMPNMTGDKLARELIRIKPEIPVIICTGYSARINPEQAMAMGIRAFISKPVLKREIAKTIRKVFDEK